MLTVLDEDYQLEYNESYAGNVHGEPTVEGYQYCMGLKRAFKSLISEQYRSFILTVVCNQILYKKSVITCINKKYPCQTYFNIQQLFGGKKVCMQHLSFQRS